MPGIWCLLPVAVFPHPWLVSDESPLGQGSRFVFPSGSDSAWDIIYTHRIFTDRSLIMRILFVTWAHVKTCPILLKPVLWGVTCFYSLTLLPTLQSDGGDSVEVTRNVENIVVKIMNVFVDALPHVPEHRRLPVLVQLVDTLGAERFLWVLLVLLFEQYVTKTVLAATYGEKVRI